jgi:hypothetical protein
MTSGNGQKRTFNKRDANLFHYPSFGRNCPSKNFHAAAGLT